MTTDNPTETYEPAHCDTHGPFQQRVFDPQFGGLNPFRSQCPECKAQATALREAKERAEREAIRERRVAELLRESGIPRRFLDRTVDGYQAETPAQRRARDLCARYVENFPAAAEAGRSLVLTGGPGTGKTHLACAIAAAVVREHVASVDYCTVSDLMRTLKETYGRKDGPTERQLIAALVDVDLLVIDEIGVQVGSEHEKLLLFDVLNGRYQEMRPTVLLSNLSADDLEAYLGHRVMDRYRECGNVVAFNWDSYRGRAAA